MKKKKPGRPPRTNGHSARLPSVRVSKDQLKRYQEASTAASMTFADWLRRVLDSAAGK